MKTEARVIMAFSILGKIRENEEEQPEFFDDLNLTRWIEEIDAQLGVYDIRDYFYRWPDGAEQIRYRQEVLQEIDEEMENKLTDFVNKIRRAQENEAYLHSDTGEQITEELSRAHWQLEIAMEYFSAVDELVTFLENRGCKTRGWQEFLTMCKEEIEAPEVSAYHEAARSTAEELGKLRYSLRIEGDHVAILPSVVEEDYVQQLCEKYPNMIKHPGKMGNLLPGGKAGTPLEKRIFKYLQKKFPQPFRKLEKFGKMEPCIYQPGIMQFHKEICVYLSILKFQHHMEYFHYDFCMPAFSETAFEVTGGYDLVLAMKNQKEGKETVANDYEYCGKERFFVITGPNQGGKTTFARAAGQLVYFSLMGFPVPAKRAVLPLFEGLLTHFSVEESMQSGRGKLKEELVRLSGMMHAEKRGVFVIINELFTSAATYDAYHMGRRVIDHFLERGCYGIYVTHIEELAEENEQIVSQVASLIEGNVKVRTFKIRRKKADGMGYVEPIVEKYGLTYEEIKRRIHHV